VILGVDGYSDFKALHSGKHNEQVQLCAFDVLAMDGGDLRTLPLSMRKANLARLLARRQARVARIESSLSSLLPFHFPAVSLTPGNYLRGAVIPHSSAKN
jgi:ATP-dependent DNA ligase